MENRPALILAVLAQADHPLRLVPPHDDSTVDSYACPCTALLDGIPRRILSDRLLSPLYGLRGSRYRRGYALTSTPEGQELHLHGDEVIRDRKISTLYPLSSCKKGRFRATDRTATGLLGPGSASKTWDTDASEVFPQEPVPPACAFYLSGRRYFAAASSPICLPMAVPTSVEVR